MQSGTATSGCYCRRCEYDLRGQVGPEVERRCPECGGAFDPEDPRTFLRRPRSKAWRWVRRIVGVALVLAIVGGGPLGWLYWGWRTERAAMAQLRIPRFARTRQIIPSSLAQRLPVWVQRLGERADTAGVGIYFAPYDGPLRVVPPAAYDGDMAFVAKLNHLRCLQLLEGGVTDQGIAQLAGMDQLEELWLDGLPLTDKSLEHIRGLRKLRVLRLYRSRITDAGIENLRGMTDLEDLQLGETQVTDQAMAVIGRMKKLKTLDLRTRVTDAGLAEVTGLTELKWLCLNGTAITDAGMVHLAGLKKLEWLSLEVTAATDEGLKNLAGLAKLDTLYLSGTRITDRGLVHLRGLTTLRRLKLDGTAITDAGLLELQKMAGLTEIEVSGTKVTAEGIAGLGKALPGVSVTARERR